MALRDLLRSRGAGVVAGTVTVVLGMGAVAALAFGGPTQRSARFGDPQLALGNGSFGASIVNRAGADDPARSSRVGGPAGAAASGAAVGTSAPASSAARSAAPAASAAAARGPAAADRAPGLASVPSGSAEVYRTMLASPGPLERSIANLSSARREDYARRYGPGMVAGGVGGATAAGLIRADRPTNVGTDPYANSGVSRPARGSASAAASGGGTHASAPRGGTADRPAAARPPAGPASGGGSSPAASTPAAAPPPAAVIPPAPPAPAGKSPASPPANVPGASAPYNPPGLVSNPAPVPTDALGGSGSSSGPGSSAGSGAAAPGGGSEGGTPAPGSVPPPSTSVVGPNPNAVVTPEPSTWLLLGSGLVGLALVSRRRRAREG